MLASNPNRHAMCQKMIGLLGFSACATMLAAQPVAHQKTPLLNTPKHYVACLASSPVVVDGQASDTAWKQAKWSDAFVDIEGEGHPAPRFQTQMKMLWDERYLYVLAELEEPHVWAYVKNRDEVVFHDNDFEVFVDPDNDGHNYFEIEINAIETVFDLFMPKPYRNGSGALISWDTPGLQAAVKVRGTANNPSDTDRGWTVELAIPFAALTLGNHPDVPREGSLWRINFSRVEWQTEVLGNGYSRKKDALGKLLPEDNWVWSPQGVVNMHCPEHWGYLLFTRQTDPGQAPPFVLPVAEKQKPYLWQAYDQQQAYHHKNGHYATTLQALGIDASEVLIDGQTHVLRLEATAHQFRLSIAEKGAGKGIALNHDGRISSIAPKKTKNTQSHD